jgi:hypothetical protein
LPGGTPNEGDRLKPESVGGLSITGNLNKAEHPHVLGRGVEGIWLTLRNKDNIPRICDQHLVFAEKLDASLQE